jgi:hypothetical protein
MHCLDHTGNGLKRLAALALIAASAAACAPTTRLDPPGPLGALIDRPAPAVAIAANAAYPNPLADPVPPLLTAQSADAIVAEPLRHRLTPAARASLADASLRAAVVATGTSVQWQSPDASGAIIPVRDPYRSHRGKICRDLQQQTQSTSGTVIDQVTLCRTDGGDGHVYWLPGSPD